MLLLDKYWFSCLKLLHPSITMCYIAMCNKIFSSYNKQDILLINLTVLVISVQIRLLLTLILIDTLFIDPPSKSDSIYITTDF